MGMNSSKAIFKLLDSVNVLCNFGNGHLRNLLGIFAILNFMQIIESETE